MIDKTICPVCNNKTVSDEYKCQFSCFVRGSHAVKFYLESYNTPKHYEIDLFDPKTVVPDFSFRFTYLSNNKIKIEVSKFGKIIGKNFRKIPKSLVPAQRFWTEEQWLSYIKNYKIM